jgi:hypothetical protein
MAMSVMCDSENGRWHTGPSSLTQQFLIAHEWRPDIAKAISATVMASSSAAVQRRVAEGYSDTAGRLLANQLRNILNYVAITRNRLIPYRTELVREALSGQTQTRRKSVMRPIGSHSATRMLPL